VHRLPLHGVNIEVVCRLVNNGGRRSRRRADEPILAGRAGIDNEGVEGLLPIALERPAFKATFLDQVRKAAQLLSRER
jgi:hypothetical protein